MTTADKVLATVRKMFVKGKSLPLTKLAARVGMSHEGVRRHVVALTKKGLIKRVDGHIVGVK